MSGKIARAFLGACGSAVRDLVQHVGCATEHASIMFSRLVSLIRVFSFVEQGIGSITSYLDLPYTNTSLHDPLITCVRELQ